MSELGLGHGFLDGRSLERLFQHREHSYVHLLAGLLDRIEDGGAAVADQLHSAGELGPAQRLDRLHCVLRLEIDVEEYEVRRSHDLGIAERGPINEFNRIDPAALQDQ